MVKRSNTSSHSSPSFPKKPTTSIQSQYNQTATETWVKCGECATTLGLIIPAIKSFENALNHDPSNPIALIGLSSSLRLNDINLNETIGSQSSIEKLNKSLQLYPKLLSKNHLIYKELSECYLLIGLNDQAHQSIQISIQLNPQDPSLWLLNAQTLIRLGSKNHATNSLTHCLNLLPEFQKDYSLIDIETSRACHAELAAIAASDGNIDISIKELSLTLSLPPPPLSRIDEHIALWCALSTAKERANDIEGAIITCQDANLAIGKNDRIIMTHCYLLLLINPVGNSEQVISLLNKIINLVVEEEKQIAKDFLPWYLLGRAYSFIDEPRLAYNSYQIALRCAPNSSINWLAVGKLYLELKQLPDALAAYSQALRLQIDEGNIGTATAWDGLSCVYERCEDHLLDASDACSRASLVFKTIGDLKNSLYFEQRSEILLKCSKDSNLKPPSLRQPPDVPNILLRDLVALAPNERINYTQSQQKQTQSQTPLQQPTRESPMITQTPQQGQPITQFQPINNLPQPPLPPPPPPPPQQQQQQPNQYLYPTFNKIDQKASPRQQLPQLPTPQQYQPQPINNNWSPQVNQQQQQHIQIPPPPPPLQQQQQQQQQQQPPPPPPPQQFYYHPVSIPPQQLPPHRSPPQIVNNNNNPSYISGPNGLPHPNGYPYGQYIPIPGGAQYTSTSSSPNWRR